MATYEQFTDQKETEQKIELAEKQQVEKVESQDQVQRTGQQKRTINLRQVKTTKTDIIKQSQSFSYFKADTDKVGNYQLGLDYYQGKILSTQYGLIIVDENTKGQRSIGVGAWCENAKLFDNGKKIIVADQDKNVMIYDAVTCSSSELWYKTFEYSCSTVDVTKDNKLFLVGMKEILLIFDMASKQQLHKFAGQSDARAQQGACFSNSGKMVASCQVDKSVALFSTTDGKLIHKFVGHTIKPFSVMFNKDDKILVSCGGDKTVYLWNVHDYSYIAKLEGHLDAIVGCDFNYNDSLLATCSKDKTIIIWDMKEHTFAHKYIGHSDIVMSVKFSDDKKHVISGGWTGELIKWKLSFGETHDTLIGHTEPITEVSLNHNDTLLATASEDKQVIIWDLQNDNKRIYTITDNTDFVNCVRFSPCGNYLSVGGQDGHIRVYATADWNMTGDFVYDRLDIRHTCFSPDSQRIVSCHRNGDVLVWNRESGEQLFQQKHADTTQYCDYSPDGKLIASCSRDRIINIWDSEKFEQKFTFQDHQLIVKCVKFSNDSRKLYSCSGDKTIIIWDLLSGEILNKLKETYAIGSLAFNSNERALYCSVDQDIIIWDIQTTQQIKTYTTHSMVVTAFALAKDESFFVTGSTDKQVHVVRDHRRNYAVINSYNLLKQSLNEDLSKHQKLTLQNVVLKIMKPLATNYYRYDGVTLLNFIIYNEDIETLKLFCRILDEQQIKVTFLHDRFGFYPLQIALTLKNADISQYLINFIATHNNLIIPSEHQPFLGEQMITRLFDMNFNNLGVMLDSRIIKPPIYNLFNKAKGFSKKFILNAFTTVIPDKKEIQDKLVQQADQAEEDPQLEYEHDTQQFRASSGDRNIEVDIKILDIQGVLSPNSELLNTIANKPSNDPIFNSEALAYILSYKWKKYAKKMYFQGAFIFFIFWFIFNATYLFVKPSRIEKQSHSYNYASYILHIIIIVYALYFCQKERHQFQMYGLDYFSEMWNYIDLSAYTLPIVVSVMDIMATAHFMISPNNLTLRIIASIAIFATWLKLLSFARGDENTAFIIRMIVNVIGKMKVFFLVTFWTMLGFVCAAFSMQMRKKTYTSDTQPGSQFEFVKLTYSILLGDFGSFDSRLFNTNTVNADVYIWIFKFICTMYLFIILMNLLIAFIADAYSEIVSKKDSSFSYEQANLINEIDRTLGQKKKQALHDELGTSYLFIAKQVVDSSLVEQQKGSKQLVISNMAKQIQTIEKHVMHMQEKNDKQVSQVFTLLQQMNQKIDDMQRFQK